MFSPAPRFVLSSVTAPLSLLSLGASNAWAENIEFMGHLWEIKSHETVPVGPGPNLFCRENIAVEDGHLHLKIAPTAGGAWCSAEVIGPSLGYGRYQFEVVLPDGQLNENVVLGLFTWSDDPSHAHREVDIELGQWAERDAFNAQCVVQPYTHMGNLKRFKVPMDEHLFLSFSRYPSEFQCEARSSSGDLIFSHLFDQGVPPAGDEAVRINLWLFVPSGPSDGKPETVIIRHFLYTSAFSD